MKIVLTGGGTGGHFYPIIAVAQEINNIAKERKLLGPRLYYIGPEQYDSRALFENNIAFRKSPAGKMRRYFSLLNFFDIFKTAWGSLRAMWQIYTIYPDVVFSKGGYASFPTVLAAKLFRIPIIVHESDTVPGKVNKWSGKFAVKVAVSFPEAARYFKKNKVALTGNPVRHELYAVAKEGGHQFLKLDKNVPTLLILGGSLGAKKINDVILDALPKLVEKYQIIHQAGKGNLEEVERTMRVVLEGNKYQNRYKVFGFLNALSLRMAAGASMLVIARAGSNTIFEIATWGLPSLIIPITSSNEDHQRKNAFAYARSGAAIVIEEKNLSANLVISEINRLIANDADRVTMREQAKKFATPHAARTIAEAIVQTALEHEAE